MKRFVLIAVMISFSVYSCIYQPQTANYVKPTIDFSRYKKIAAIKLESQDASVGQEVADTISISFSKAGYNVIERSQLKAIIDENTFIQSGLTGNSKTALKVAGIDALVTGAVTKYDCTLDKNAFSYGYIAASFTINNCQASLSIKMIDVNSGDVLWTFQGSHALKAENITAGRVMQQIIAEMAQKIPIRESIARTVIDAPIKVKAMDVGSVYFGKAKAEIEYNADAIGWTEKSTKNATIKNWSETIRMASVAIAIDPTYPEAYVNRSWAYLEKGFPDEAFADCQKALELDNNNAGAHNNRGLFYLRNSQSEMAKNDFEAACTGGLEVGCSNYKLITGYKPSEKVEFFLKKAEEAFNNKNWDGVIKYTSEIPNNEVVLSIRGGAYAYKGMFSEAISNCDEAIKINPNYALAYNNKGFTLEMMGKKKEAMLNYEFACNLNMALGCDNLNKLAYSITNPILH